MQLGLEKCSVWGPQNLFSAVSDYEVLVSSDPGPQHALGQFTVKCEAVGMGISTVKSEASEGEMEH